MKEMTPEEIKEYKNARNKTKAANAKLRGHMSHRAWLRKHK